MLQGRKTPTNNKQKNMCWRSLCDVTDDGPRHTPMYVAPATNVTSQRGQVVWSPYSAGDEAAKIAVNPVSSVFALLSLLMNVDQRFTAYL